MPRSGLVQPCVGAHRSGFAGPRRASPTLRELNLNVRRKNMKTITRIISLAVFIGSLSILHADVTSKIVDADIGQGLANKTGRDGRTVVYPMGWNTKEGKDGRMVAYPLGWFDKEGKDGRVVAYPLGWFDKEGKDGRVVAYPLGWFDKEGKDGRVVVYPLGWFDKEGKDGRIVVYRLRV